MAGKLGNLHGNKDHQSLLRIWADFHPGNNDRLLIVGRDDGHESAIRAQIAGLGLDGTVVLTGARPDVEVLQNACDVIVLCATASESSPNAVLEDMALGKPVLGNTVAGLQEILGSSTYEGVGEASARLNAYKANPHLREQDGKGTCKESPSAMASTRWWSR